MKRDYPIDAWEEGWLAHHAGLALSSCPYGEQVPELRDAWRLGWRDARRVRLTEQPQTS